MDKINSADPNLIPGFLSLTKQQAFDIAARHLLEQRKPSVCQGTCSYKGIGCAASPFLKEEARESLKGSWPHITRETHLMEFIHALQLAHDTPVHGDHGIVSNGQWFDQWKANMLMIAKASDLDGSIIYG